MSNNSFKVKNSTVLTPKDLSTLTNPEAGELACDINDNNKIKKYDVLTSSWSEVGSGASSLDTVFQLIGDDVPNWSKGNNASFLGGGSLAGTFAAESTTPLNGPQSYKYTQAAGSLNDYIASPIKSVPSRFRGQECTLYFPFDYNGNSNDIRVVFYDVTNSQEIPSSVYLESSPTISIFKTNIVIPSTCANIRVGFQVAVVNSGKILEFDDVVLSNDTTVYADIANENQSAGYPTSGSNITIASPSYSSGSGLFSVSSSQITVLRSCKISITSSVSLNTTDVATTLVRNGNTIAYDRARIATATSLYASASATVDANAGDIFTFITSAAAVGNLIISATASNSNLLTAPETFSTDTAPLTYASSSSYTDSTLENAPIGTFITFTYAANTNTRTQTTTAPTQTTSDMVTNGIQLTARAYNAASTAAAPAAIMIQIGKGMKGVSTVAFANTQKTNQGTIDFYNYLANVRDVGILINSYNEKTGILYIDAGVVSSNAVTTHFLGAFNSVGSAPSYSSSGYLVINASKNPALTGLNINAVAARGVNTAGTSISNVGDTIITYDAIKPIDTHSALNAAAGVFTAPETGYYQVSFNVRFSSQTYAAGNNMYGYIDKNGSTWALTFDQEISAANTETRVVSGSSSVYLTKNDTVSIKVRNNRTAGATPLDIQPGVVTFNIVKVS